MRHATMAMLAAAIATAVAMRNNAAAMRERHPEPMHTGASHHPYDGGTTGGVGAGVSGAGVGSGGSSGTRPSRDTMPSASVSLAHDRRLALVTALIFDMETSPLAEALCGENAAHSLSGERVRIPYSI